ncbi:MAG: hypothetical protein ACI4D2_04300 [Lachnospiraceae bacterium]
MGIKYSEVNFDRLIEDLSNCCLGEASCGGCDKPRCIVGYAQNCAIGCLKNNVSYVMNGDTNIPFTDFKIYQEEDFAKGIAHTLKMCRSCESDHYDQCIISVIRNCYEIGLFGEALGYDGSNFRYLNQIQSQNPQIANDIVIEFNRTTV